MRVSIRSDICLALRLIATQEHYRKTQDWLAMLPELQQRTSIIVQSQSIIEIQAAEILRLRAENDRLNDIITLWIDCCLNLDVDRYFTPEDKIEEARSKLKKARRATYKEETRRKHANT